MAKLYDYKGDPVDLGVLRKRGTAAPELAGIRSVWNASAVAGLTPERLGQILGAVDNNDSLAYLTLAMEMEEREPHYAAQLATRTMAVKELTLIVEGYDDSAEATTHADLVRDVLKGEDKQDLVASMMDAVGKGFSVTEMEWNRDGKVWYPECFTWIDPRFFQFDRTDGRTIRLRDLSNGMEGIDLYPFKFVTHTPKLKMGLPIRTGLARLTAVSFMCKSYALKDWLAFAEVFGMPLRVGKYAAGATDDEKSKLLTAVASIGTDAACIIEESMLIEFIEANRDSNGADKLFQGLADWLDSQVSKAVLGQTMTADSGSSLSQAKVHDQVRHDILGHDATTVAASIMRDVVKPIIDLNFGVQDRNKYPTVRLDYEEAEDLESLSKSLAPFVDRGLRVQSSLILDKFGLPEAEDGAEVLVPANKAKAADEPEGEEQPGKKGLRVVPEPEEEEDEDVARRKVEVALLRRVQAGETLTADQRAFLVLRGRRQKVATAAAREPEDEVERIATEALMDWEALTEPLVGPIEELAKTSTDYADFASKLEQLVGELGIADFTRSLATAAFKARALGDVKDDPS